MPTRGGCSQNSYLWRRGGCQNRWHSLVHCDHDDSTTSRFDSPGRAAAPRARTMAGTSVAVPPCTTCCRAFDARAGSVPSQHSMARAHSAASAPARNGHLIEAPWGAPPLTGAGAWRARRPNSTAVSRTAWWTCEACRWHRSSSHTGGVCQPASISDSRADDGSRGACIRS
jgi:hypothetical protein